MAKNDEYSSKNGSISDSDSCLLSDSDQDRRQAAKRKDTNKLDHIVTNKIKIKDQCNDAITYDPKFGNVFSLSTDYNKDTLPIVTVNLIKVNKNRANTIAVLTCLLYRGATYITINRKHTRPYERIMRSNKVKYSMLKGPYFTTHDVKVLFLIADFSISKIISHRFHVEKV